MPIEKIIKAAPRGFCAGVDRAIEIVERAIEIFGTPIYVRHQIVHNDFVIKTLEEKGAVFVEELDEIPDPNAVVIFSAHGIPPQVKQDAIARGHQVLDATCPLVTKVHLEAIRFHKEGYEIIIVGHKGHQEVIGTMGEAPMTLIETVEDAQNIKIENPEKVAVITQTTLSVDDTREILETLQNRFPEIKLPPAKDICYATQNRQDAVKELAKQCSLILVVGATNSSNSNRLVETAKRCGSESYLIPNAAAIQEEWLENHTTVGISSGASVPDVLVEEVVAKLQSHSPRSHASLLTTKEENMKFALPKEVAKEQWMFINKSLKPSINPESTM